MDNNIILIGLDGGATKISGWTINVDPGKLSFTLGDTNVQKEYRTYEAYRPDFRAVDIKKQLRGFNSGIVIPTETEKVQAQAYTQACIDVLMEIAAENPGRPVLAGLGMPGLKMSDQRGIAVLLNGPRIPDYCQTVESAINKLGIKLIVPFQRIGSDADYCGIGEEYSAAGSFRDVASAYYLGGGTGTADALKIDGELIPFDKAKDWLAKSWELQNDKGKSLERYASAGGIQSIYSDYSGIAVDDLNRAQIFPDQILERAVEGEQDAVKTFRDISKYLAKLIFERMRTIFSGWKQDFSFMNPSREGLSRNHHFTGTLLDRIIFGQRLAVLLEASKSTTQLWQPLLDNLTDLVFFSAENQTFKDHYLRDGQFNPDLIINTALREAPAIGAGIDAYLHYKGLI